MYVHTVNQFQQNFSKKQNKQIKNLFSILVPKKTQESQRIYKVSLTEVLTMTKMESPSFTAQFPMVPDVQCLVSTFLLCYASSYEEMKTVPWGNRFPFLLSVIS